MFKLNFFRINLYKPTKKLNRHNNPTITAVLLPVILLLFIVLIAGGLYIDIVYYNEVYLVNGTSEAYKVTINKKEYLLPEYGMKKLHLFTKSITVSGDSRQINLKQHTFSLDSDDAFIFNPDRQALVVKEETIYAVTTPPEVPDPYEFFIGDNIYMLSGVDYKFRGFPETIELGYSGDLKVVYRVYTLTPDYPGQIAETLIAHEGVSDKFYDYLEMYLTLNRWDSVSLDNYVSFADTGEQRERVRSFLEKSLDAPDETSIEWHRSYQNVMEAYFSTVDIYTMYRDFYAEKPDSPVRAYLLGNIEPDYNDAVDYFLISEAGEEPIGYGFSAVSFYYMCLGKYEKAYTYALRAYAVDSYRFGGYIDFLAEILAEYKLLTAQARVLYQENPDDLFTTTRYLRLLWLSEQDKEAKQVRADFKKQYSREDAAYFDRYFEFEKGYIEGDLEKSRNALAKIQDSNDNKYKYYIVSGNVRKFEDFIKNSVYDSAYNNGILYLLADYKDKNQVARRALSKMLGFLKEEGKEAARLAALFENPEEVTIGDIEKIMIHPTYKAVYVAILGRLNPRLRKQCYNLARTLSPVKAVPYYLIREVTRP